MQNPSEPDGDDFVEPQNSLRPLTLEELPDTLKDACRLAGWEKLMPVQSRALPYLLANRDMMIQSRTGSGKTGAFILPMLERINAGLKECQALVLVPTRELARQVEKDAALLAGDRGVKTVAVYGGVGFGPQATAIREGAHLVVGTPGRILDHLLRKTLSFDNIQMLIFDEADRMLSMGFLPDMQEVKRYLPKRRINACLFSATFPPHVIRLSGMFLEDPEMLSLSQDHVHVTDIEHISYQVPGMDKDRALIRIIEMENPSGAIIFCNTKSKVSYVCTVLQRFGYDADELSSDLSQTHREKVLQRVRDGNLRFLVATDVAARGIDIPNLSHVVQFEPPEDPEAYIHRAGRTGRAGASGEAITLVAGIEKIEMARIAKRYKIDLQDRALPSDEDVEGVVTQRTTALLEAKLRGLDNVQKERLQRFVRLGKELAENEDESMVMAMLLDDYYQQSLHAPLTPPEPREKSSPKPRREGGRPGGDRGGRRRR